MSFLKIEDERNDDIWVNTDKIDTISEVGFKGEDMTRIDFNAGFVLTRETPEEIIKRMAEL